MKFNMNGIFTDHKNEGQVFKRPFLRGVFSFVASGILSFLAMFIVIISLTLLGILVGNSPEAVQQFFADSPYTHSFDLFITVIPIMIFLVFELFVSKHSFKSLGFSLEKWISNYASGYLVGLLMILACVLVLLATGSVSFEFNETLSIGVLFAFLFGFIIQGMSEEVICRSILFPIISSKFGIIAGILGNSLLFAVLHINNPNIGILGLDNIALFGMFMSLIYYYYQNIWIISGIHSAWNFAQGNIFGISVSGIDFTGLSILNSNVDISYLTGGSFGFEGGLICTIILIVSIGITIGIYNKKNTVLA